MAYYTNCPDCGKTNVKGKRTNSAVPMFSFIGGLAGLTLGPAGPLIGAPIGAGVGKILNKISAKRYSFSCPRCGTNWEEEM